MTEQEKSDLLIQVIAY